MASAKFQGGKYHTATEVKAHFRHDDISVENRKVASRGNPNIDVTKSHLNKSLLGLTYEQMCEKYDKRIAQLDAITNTNHRKDRVTLQNIEIPVPRELDRNLYNKWFVKVAEILCSMYGQMNFVDGQIHWDEEHEYVSADTGEVVTSRVHAHYSIIPEVKGVLNCKKMSGRTNMKKLNKAIEDMTQKEFGCSFMTGEKTKSCHTIDELKNRSNQLALERREQNCKQQEQTIAEAEKRLLESEKAISEQEQAVECKMANLGEYERLGADYYNRAKLLFDSLSREDEMFKANKEKLYRQSLERIQKIHTELNESLLPQAHRKKQKERSL